MPMMPNTDDYNFRDEDDVTDGEPESYFDDSEEGSFEYEFEDRIEIGGGNPYMGLYIFFAIIVLVFVSGVFCIMGSTDDDAGKGPSVDRKAEREWCIQHTPSKQELARCLNDPSYRPNHD